jgi:hypothetical protein
MKRTKTNSQTQLQSALCALKMAVVQGANWRYEHLVEAAIRSGATDEDIDAVAHQALQALLAGAEQPLTSRELATTWRPGHFRRS